MKCEICRKAPAETAITLDVDGEPVEYYVCEKCAAEAKARKHRATCAESPDPDPDPVAPAEMPSMAPPPGDGDPEDEIPREIIEGLAKFAMDAGAVLPPDKRRCPKCGRSVAEVFETQRLGCPTCWKFFADLIRVCFHSVQYGPENLAKPQSEAPAPAKRRGAGKSATPSPAPEPSAEDLKRELAEAVKREDFMRAAEIKRRLDSLESGSKEQR